MSCHYELSTKSKHFLVSFIFLLYRFKMDNHIALLKRLCRLCGGRCLSSAETKAGKCAKECSHYVEKIASTFQVDVSHDDASTHPPHMCHSCYTFLFLSVKPTKAVPAWPHHSRTGICTVEGRSRRTQGVAGLEHPPHI